MTEKDKVQRPRRLDSNAAADYIGVSRTTLPTWRCLKRYSIPFLRVGRKIYYRVDDLDRWLESRTVR